MSTRMKIIALLFAGVALVVGLWAGKYHQQNNSTDAVSSTILTPPQPIADFSLIDTKGRPFTNHSLWGHWTFLFFGFTSCAQICPPTMTNLNQMYNRLLQQEQNPMPQVVLISIDPQNDTLAKLGSYVDSFNSHFQGATGDQAQIDKLAASLNVLYMKTLKDKQTGETTIDHSGAILLIDPAGKLAAVFSMPHDPTAMAKDFRLIVANSG